MKKTVLFFSFLVFALNFFGQKNSTKSVTIGSAEYKDLKRSGELESLRLDGKLNLIQPSNPFQQKKVQSIKNTSKAKKAGSTCYGYFPPNVAPQAALGDDQSIQVTLPFNFCFYGTNYNALWINDNGTVSFDQAHGAFTAQGFPFTTGGIGAEEIIAPFWADFEQTGALSGPIYYEVLPTALIVHWEDVGYYDSNDDKLNTMMLILTDGLDPLLQPGTNVGFFYEDMQWTTGDASLGVNGFGGTAATVGANKGDGTSYVQFGRFDGPGTAYDGPFTANDSVSWLDNKSFMFDICNSNNLPPIVAGIDFCDTLRLCVGDTLPINASFLAPEADQTTWLVIDSSQADGFHALNVVSGTAPTAQVDAIFIGDTSNIGVNIVNFLAYDNGVPSDTIQFDYVILVDSMPFLPVIVGDTSYCQGDNVVLDAGSGFDSYLWNNDSISQTITVTQGSYSVQAFLNGCSFTTEQYVVAEYAAPPLQITGDTLYCPEDSSLLNATPGFESYLWNTSASDTLDSVYVFQGSYFVTITDTNNCEWNSNTISVIDFTNTVNIFGDTTYCLGENVTLFAQPGHDSYVWNSNPADSLDSLIVEAGDYYVTATSNGCTASDSISVTLTNVPEPVITGENSYCESSNLGVFLNADSSGFGYNSYSWTNSSSINSVIQAFQGTYTVTATFNGCSAVSAPFTVTESQTPEFPPIIGDLFYCTNADSGTVLTTLGTYNSYSWSNGDTTQSTFSYGGNITLSVDSNDCPSAAHNVFVDSSTPLADFNPTTDFCPGGSTVLTATQGMSSYLWSNGVFGPTIDATPGNYTLTVTDNNGCVDDSTIVISSMEGPNADFTISPLDYQEPNLPVIFTSTSTFSSGTIDEYIWDFDVNLIGNPAPATSNSSGPVSVVYGTQGIHTISLYIEADNGCSDTISKEYLIVDKVIASTIITPNGDFNNDKLVFKNLKYYTNNKLTIYSRWGNTIFEQENYLNDWEGGGHPVGTYFFILEIESLEEPLKGSFTILE
jgi:gliding motility-associated-like protein